MCLCDVGVIFLSVHVCVCCVRCVCKEYRAGDRRGGINTAVSGDVASIFKGKSVSACKLMWWIDIYAWWTSFSPQWMNCAFVPLASPILP